MICRNIRKRQYNFKTYFYCTIKRKEITFDDCTTCKKFEVRTYAPINKVSKKREFVKPETYNAVIERDNHTCRLSDQGNCQGKLELHHIVYRSEDITRINDITNCIMLCTKHHKLVHSNKRKYKQILEELINNG